MGVKIIYDDISVCIIYYSIIVFIYIYTYYNYTIATYAGL